MCSSNLEQCRDFNTGVMDSVLGVPVTERAKKICSNWRRDIYFCNKFRKRELQWSNLECTREVSIADAVLRSRLCLMRRRSQIWQLHALDKAEIQGLEKLVRPTRPGWNLGIIGYSRKRDFRWCHPRKFLKNRTCDLAYTGRFSLLFNSIPSGLINFPCE